MSSRVLEPPRQQQASPHTHVQSQFAAYLANDLAPTDQAGVGAHLHQCPACATALVGYLQNRRRIRELLHSLPRYPAPQSLRVRLLAIPDTDS
jgi:anti-sigma factor RsiW